MKALPNLKTTIEKLLNEQQNSVIIGTVLSDDLNCYNIKISLETTEDFHNMAIEEGVLLSKNPQLKINLERLISDKILNLSSISNHMWPEMTGAKQKLSNKVGNKYGRKMSAKDWLKMEHVLQKYFEL